MLPSYEDIIEKAGPADWWDQNGAPRYGEFHPRKVTIYNKIVGLFRIECQDCNKPFDVAHVYPTAMDMIRFDKSFGGLPQREDYPDASNEEWAVIWEEYVQKFDDFDPTNFHYGDPPNHGCPGAGDTMNCIDIACLQWWVRDKETLEWHRAPEKEGIFPLEQDNPLEDLPDV